MTPEEWENAQFSATVKSVAIASPPVVTFSVIDNQGRPIEGLEKLTSQSSSTTLASYPNLGFSIAKLMPRTDSKPASWVSYIVTAVSSTTGAVTGAQRPNTDANGTLEAVTGQAGTYKYTFRRDIPATKTEIDKLTFSGNNRKEDLGDLTWQPNLPHRLVIQIGGAARGTGSNTPAGGSANQTTPAVNMANPVNLIYDFIPATGEVLTPDKLAREDVSIANCNVCHNKLAIHGGGSRVEVRYCVTCHTEQRGYGYQKYTSEKFTSTFGENAIGFAPTTFKETPNKNAVTGVTSYDYSPDMRIADGEVLGNFVTMIHKLHQGHTLVKQNYNYDGLAFNTKGFSKLGEGQKMCTTCHGGTAATTASNYREIPSRQSCGACHDGIKWDTGSGSTLGDKMKVVYAGDALTETGHLGGAVQDDSTCKSCHTADGIKISHRTENITKNNPEITPGLATFRYEIKSATVDPTTNNTTIEFAIWQRIAPAPSTDETKVTLVSPAASVSNPLTGFTGGPSFLLPYALSQDGISTPIDYNNLGRKQAQPRSVSIASLLSTNNAAVGSIVPSVTNSGYYTATILGSGGSSFPVGAKMRAVALQGYFTQITPPASATAGIGRHAISVIVNVKDDAVRRTVVDSNKCAGCHEWFEGHGGNRVYEIQVCVACHVPGLASSGRGVPDSLMNTWKFSIAEEKILKDWGFTKTGPQAALKLPVITNNLKDMIHGIHIGRERVTPRTFQSARDATSRQVVQLLDFRRMEFPGTINNCESCHTTYTGTGAGATQTYAYIPAGALASVYESIDATYAANIVAGTATTADALRSLNTANNDDIVRTPWAGACTSCHESDASWAHVTINGGFVGTKRSAAQPSPRPLEDVESCAVCHGPGKSYDTAVVHK